MQINIKGSGTPAQIIEKLLLVAERVSSFGDKMPKHNVEWDDVHVFTKIKRENGKKQNEQEG